MAKVKHLTVLTVLLLIAWNDLLIGNLSSIIEIILPKQF